MWQCFSSLKMKILFYVFLVSSLQWTESAKILAVFHMPTHSHHVIGTTLLKGLAARGHDVTMASPFSLKETVPNYKDVHLHGLTDIKEEFRSAFSSVHNTSLIDLYTKLGKFTDIITEVTLNCTGMQDLLKSEEKFDVVIIEALSNEAHFGIAQRFNAHLVVISPNENILVNHLTGNSAPFSFVPSIMSNSGDKMTFNERFTNTLLGLVHYLSREVQTHRAQEALYNKYFQHGPEFSEVLKNVSLVLVNSHVCLETPRPYLPNMIQVGGIHVAKPKKLPKDLQMYLDEAKEGVIYFSLGSNLRSADLPLDKLNIIMNTFKKLPQKVLWKFEEENLPGKPDNVKISKWFPQLDILAHPNVKLFITHGGLMSYIESVYMGVPLIGIPFYGDQKANTYKFVRAEYGLKIQFADMTEETFSHVLEEILHDPKYQENIKRISEIIRDRSMSPLDTAIYWIEHIIRHKGGKHLRSVAADLSLTEYYILDVIAFIVVVLSTFLVGIILVCKTLCCTKKYRNSTDKNSSTKTKAE